MTCIVECTRAAALVGTMSHLHRDQQQRAELRLVHERRLPLGHFDARDPETPDVDLSVVVHPTNQLRGHPVGGPDHTEREG